MGQFTLRPYQQEIVDAVMAAFDQHDSVLAVSPTGTGKTIAFAEIAERWAQGRGRTLIVCPMLELIGQSVKKLYEHTQVMPSVEQGLRWANESEWAKCEFVVASKQTLCSKSKRYRKFKDIGLVIFDEAHTTITIPYKELADYFQAQGAKVLGVTATPARFDGRGLLNLYDHCAYNYGMLDAIDDGWLVSANSKCVRIRSMDLSNVRTTAGDFNHRELDAVLEDEHVELEIADVVVRESGSMKTVVYCASVEQARKIAEIVARYGIQSGFVCSDKKLCPDHQRNEVLASFTQDPNGIQVVANVGVLTTGWDFPGLMHIVMARPTRSRTLFEQIIGRATRPLPGVVDFAGSTAESRKAAIAASGKPWFYMTDIVDNSLQHKIITSLDVLGGKVGFEAVARAKQESVGSERTLAIDALRAAAEKISQEHREEERRRRERIMGRAEYTVQPVDLFDAYDAGTLAPPKLRGWRMPFGKYRGKLLRDISVGYLKWVLNSTKSKGLFTNAVKQEIARREAVVRHGLEVAPATDAQKRVLSRYGRPTFGLSYADAAAVINEINTELRRGK